MAIVRIFLRLLLVGALSVAPAWAGLSALPPYARLSPDGTRILVMLPRDRAIAKKYGILISLPDGRAVNLIETFSRSGSYDAATLAPLWQVDWYALEGQLRWSPDFTNVTLLNRHALSGGPALTFFHGGREVCHYDCDFLLTGFRDYRFFEFSPWDYYYEWYDGFTEQDGQIRLSTARRRLKPAGMTVDLGLQEFYTFDATTGAILKRDSTGRNLIWTYVVALGLLFGVAPAVYFSRRWLARILFQKKESD